MSEQLTIKLIRFVNIGGIEELEIEPGALTMIEGRNGRGKTSVIDGILALLGSGSSSDLLREGADSGEVYAELSNGTWFRRRFTRSTNTLTAGNPETGAISRAKAYLESLISTAALDPARFLAADDEKRAQMVVAAAPIAVTPQEIGEALGDIAGGISFDSRGHALDVINRVHKIVYDMRTGVNAVAKRLEGSLADLRDTLPSDAPAGPVDVASVRAELVQLQEQARAAEQSIEHDTSERISNLRAIRDEAIEAARAEFERLCAEAREQCERACEDARLHGAESIRALHGRVQPRIAELEATIKSAEQANAAAETYERTRQRIAARVQEIEAEKAKSRALTEALVRLDALKTSKASQLPLRKAEIRDGKLFLHTDGGVVPSTRANRAEQVKAALELCLAVPSKIRFIVADSLECLDSDTRAQLERAAPKMGIQIIGTRVTDDEQLVVRTVNARNGAQAGV